MTGYGTKRILITSDLHLGHTDLPAVQAMGEKIARRAAVERWELCAVVAAGDIGEDLRMIRSGLDALHPLAPLRIFIPGNHDLFDSERMGSSLRRYRDHLPALVTEAGWEWGDSRVHLIGGVQTRIVCTPAWRCPTRLPSGERIPRALRDDLFRELPDAKWLTGIDDEDLQAEQLRRFRENLANFGDASHLVVVSHYPVLAEQIGLSSDQESSAVDMFHFSPQFGAALAEALARYPRPPRATVVSGHTHSGRCATIHREAIALETLTVDSGYGRPGYCVVETG